MIGAILGFLGPWMPDAIGWLRDFTIGKRDDDHEIRMMELRLQHADADADRRTWSEAITAGASDAASARRYQPALGIRLLDAAKGSDVVPRWILALLTMAYGGLDVVIGSVRPAVTYGVVGAYLLLFGAEVWMPLGAVLESGGDTGLLAGFRAVVATGQVATIVEKWFFADVVLSVIFFWFGQRTRSRALAAS